MYCVYKIIDARNNEIIYIGQTKNFKGRKYLHFSTRRSAVAIYIAENNRDNFEMIIIKDEIETKEEALKFEDELIVAFSPMMNKVRSGLISKNKKEYYKEYRKLHNDEIKQEQEQEEYKQYQKQYHKQWYEQHKECLLLKAKEYYKNNKEEISAKRKELYKQHKENQNS